MAQPDLATIATSAVVAAAVAGGAAFLNGWRERASRRDIRRDDREHERGVREADRAHEDRVRQADREHELRVRELADAHLLRDRKLERLRSNLVAVNSAALAISDRADELSKFPMRFTEQTPHLNEAISKLVALRSAIVLDIEGDALLRAVNELQRHYGVALHVINVWAELVDRAQAGDAEASQRVPPAGLQATKELGSLTERALAIVEQSRQALETLEGVRVLTSPDEEPDATSAPAAEDATSAPAAEDAAGP